MLKWLFFLPSFLVFVYTSRVFIQLFFSVNSIVVAVVVACAFTLGQSRLLCGLALTNSDWECLVFVPLVGQSSVNSVCTSTCVVKYRSWNQFSVCGSNPLFFFTLPLLTLKSRFFLLFIFTFYNQSVRNFPPCYSKQQLQRKLGIFMLVHHVNRKPRGNQQ